MADVFDAQERSEIMSRIRSRGNKSTELLLVGIFKERCITGWRRKQKLPGKPDFVFRKERVCVFVDGCFWHGCPKCFKPPKTNEDYWTKKIEKNRVRDQKITRELGEAGWSVLRIWEHELLKKCREDLLRRLRLAGLKSASTNRPAAAAQ